jgi:hypothetical protein
MKITRENYEIWFLDFMEGRLNRQETEEVRTFMSQHPDLADEMENIVPPLFSDPEMHFPGKEKLKKDQFEDPEILEHSIIARMEGDLNEAENYSLDAWLTHHPEKRQLVKLYENTRLKPDLDLVFPDKAKLKKKSTLRVVWIRVASIAAVLLMLFFLFQPEKLKRDQPATTIAENPVPSGAIAPSLSPQATARPLPLTAAKKTAHSVSNQIILSRKLKRTDRQKTLLKSVEERSYVPIPAMQARTAPVNSFELEFADLMPVKDPLIQYTASNDILMSTYFTDKLRELKAEGTGGVFSREGLAVAGLKLFSWLPGRRLTGKQGTDGRLKSITFSTQLLAFSIPLNRGL